MHMFIPVVPSGVIHVLAPVFGPYTVPLWENTRFVNTYVFMDDVLSASSLVYVYLLLTRCMKYPPAALPLCCREKPAEAPGCRVPMIAGYFVPLHAFEYWPSSIA